MRLIVVASSLVLSLLLGAAAADAGTGPRVTVITDSAAGVLLWDGEANQILGHGFDLDVEPIICRKLVEPGCGGADPLPASALATVNQLGPALGKIVVIDTGYNDTTAELAAAVDPLMQALLANGVEHVIWVNYVQRLSLWADHDAVLAAAAPRWPQMTVADWNAVALPHNEWFVDAAHLDTTGGRALATFLHPFLVDACGSACAPKPVYCGLARTVNGFDYVEATSFACAAARTTAVAIERRQPGAWACSREVNGTIELTCTEGDARIDLLERSPVPARRVGNVVSLASWTFRLLRSGSIQGHNRTGSWLTFGRAPWCIPGIPREVLIAFALEPLTRNGGCFTLRRPQKEITEPVALSSTSPTNFRLRLAAPPTVPRSGFDLLALRARCVRDANASGGNVKPLSRKLRPIQERPTPARQLLASAVAMSSELAIDLRGVVKRYGAITAVDGLDVQVPAGTCVGLLGPNGAGKSTTMRMLTGQTIADEGELDVLGFKMPDESKQARAQLGVTPQLDNLDVTLTVEQNLLVFTYLYRVPRKERKAAIARGLELARLEDRRDTRVDKLSGGMRRRLLIARSLVHRPRLVLLDEPTVGLDPQIRQELWALIDRLRNEGTTILMSTHYIEEAQRLADTVLIMSHGKAVAAGAPADLVAEHAGSEVLEVYGGPARLAEVEQEAAANGLSTRRTGTSVAVLGTSDGFDGERRPANLEDVFVLLTGEEIG